LEEVTVQNPYNITAWETLAEAYEKSAEVYIAKGEINKAEQLLEKCLSIPERIIELNRKSPKEDPGVEKLTATKNLMLYIAKAEKHIESPDKGTMKTLRDLVFSALFGVDLDEDGRADIWYFSGEGDIKINPGKGIRIKPAGQSQVTLLLTETINLKENEYYRIELEADILKGQYRIEVIADNKVVFSSNSNLFEFTAPEEDGGKEARIRVIVSPESDIVLKRIFLYQ